MDSINIDTKIENEILKIIKKQDSNLEMITKKLENIDNDLINKSIEKLITSQKIFLDCKGKYCYITDEYVVGTLENCSKELKSVKHNKDKIIIPPEKTHTALTNDLVVVLPIGNTGEVVGIINRKNKKLVCEVKVKNNKLKLVPFNGNKEVSIITDKELLKDLIEGDRVYITLDNKVDMDNTVLAKEVVKIGHFNDKMNDEISIAISKDFDIDFSKETLEEVKNIPTTVSEKDKENRLDLTNETIFTIDSISTKDMDDAISIKKLYNGNYLLGVHIADVAYYLKPDSPIFKEALKRGTSVYLGNVVIPMIPSELSNGICSLNEGVERLTKSCIMEINPKGKVVNYKIVDSVIKSKKKMTYEDLNRIFNEDDLNTLFNEEEIDISYYPFLNDLNLMRELSEILSKSKNKRGHLNFESSDIKIKHDDNDAPIDFEHRLCGDSEKLIENFMIIANETIATDFYWRELPFIYRVHNNPDELKLEDTIELINKLGYGYKLVRIQNACGQKAIQSILKDYEGTPAYTIISNLLLRNMAKAKYSTENIGHYALASDNYCHFTSPIRRFPDLIVHTLINQFINDKSGKSYKHLNVLLEKLKDICIHSSYKERQADKAERDYVKLKMAQYMAEHINEEFEGVVLDIDSDNVYIKLNNNIKGILDFESDINSAFTLDTHNKELKCKYSKQKINLGTKLKVIVTKVDIPQKEVYFDIKEIIKNNDNKHIKKLELKND